MVIYMKLSSYINLIFVQRFLIHDSFVINNLKYYLKCFTTLILLIIKPKLRSESFLLNDYYHSQLNSMLFYNTRRWRNRKTCIMNIIYQTSRWNLKNGIYSTGVYHFYFCFFKWYWTQQTPISNKININIFMF
jgi:hypothetical protein